MNVSAIFRYRFSVRLPEIAKYAGVCGGAGIHVTRPEDLETAVLRAMTMNRPVIIDGDTDVKRF
ncbi:MAG: hypothetical protein M0Q92_00890 [Methanoregula sp.]|nr:hypothetical protein [Methanoregula sp.]